MRKKNTVTYQRPIFNFKGHAGNMTSARTIPATISRNMVFFLEGKGNLQA
jgi:hypothetical protein